MRERAVLVIGLGNDLRGDDGAGARVVRALRESARSAGIDVRELPGEPVGLLEAWERHEAVIVVDAMRSGAPAGTIRRFELGEDPLRRTLRSSSSTHALSLEDALELGRVLNRLPAKLVIFAVEGASFETGDGLSPEVERVTSALAELVLAEAGALRRP